jgi:hypothetical protein
MKGSLRQQLLTNYPAWHDNPLSLSIAEIETPISVFTHFFECYTLPQIRVCLKELVYDSLLAEDTDAPSHVTTHEALEKLVEAAWVIYQRSVANTYLKGENWVDNHNAQSSNIIQNEEIPAIYRSINEFFDSFTLPSARQYLQSAIKAAECSQIWENAAPSDLLYFFGRLEELLTSVFSLVKMGKKLKQVLLPNSNSSLDLIQYHLYCSCNEHHRPWEYFPRSLSAKEYLNPYKTLEKFTAKASKKEWKEILHYLLTYALGGNSLSELGVHLELVSISEHLHGMLEACHLVYVRTMIQNPKR